jgi:hypothetical protein
MNQYPGYSGVNPYAAPQAPVGVPAYGPGPGGVHGASAYVDGTSLVAPNGSTLPAMCLKCGQQPTQWRQQAYQYTPPWAFFVLGWIGLLIFSKRSSFQVPLCQEHGATWKTWNLIAGVSWIPGVLFLVLGAMLSDGDSGVGPGLIIAGTLLFLVGLFTALILRSRKIVNATRIDKTYSWLRGVHPSVLQVVASGQGAYPAAPSPYPYGGAAR